MADDKEGSPSERASRDTYGHDPRRKQGRGRDRTHIVHGGRVLSSAASAERVRPGNGAALSSLCPVDPGTERKEYRDLRDGSGTYSICPAHELLRHNNKKQVQKKEEMVAKISVKDLRIDFGNINALKGTSIDIEKNEILGIIGPANSGKTSFLRAINRLN